MERGNAAGSVLVDQEEDYRNHPGKVTARCLYCGVGFVGTLATASVAGRPPRPFQSGITDIIFRKGEERVERR